MDDAGLSTSNLENLPAVVPQILWSARPDGTVDWINSEFERYTGITGADYSAGEWLNAVHPDDHEATLLAWEHARNGGRGDRAAFRVWCATRADWRWHLVGARPQRTKHGGILRWFGNAIDIQDFRDVQEAQEAELRLQVVEGLALEGVSANEPLATILRNFSKAMADVLPGAKTAIAVLNDAGTHLESCYGSDALEIWASTLGPVAIGEGRGTCAAAVSRREPVYSNDVALDPVWEEYRAAVAENGVSASWSVPILDEQKVPLGSFACYLAEPCAPDETQKALFHRMGTLVTNVFSRVRERDRLQESERRYRTLFDFLPIAIWEEDVSRPLALIAELKSRGVSDLGKWLDANPAFIERVLMSINILDVNRAGRALYQIPDSTAEAYERSMMELADQAGFRAAVRHMLISAWTGKKETAIAYRVHLPDGSEREIFLSMLLPEADSGRLLVVALDITDQRRAEERFRHVAQVASDYIFERDFATEMLWVSDGSGWDSALPPGPCEVPRADWVNRVHPDDASVLDEIERAILNGDERWDGEYRLRMISGEYVPVQERASFIRDQNGIPIRMIGNLVDLSEQKALEAQLRQAQRLDAVGQLTGGIAHDFNNLLTVILGNADTIAEVTTDPQAQQLAQLIVGASERASELTQHLLAFARKQPLSPSLYDACGIMEGMRVLIERAITPDIALELDLDEHLGLVRIDRAMFESALLNLCLNARDAMPDGGTLRISAEVVAREQDQKDAQDRLRIAVTDTGTGMDSETLAQVFEPFFTTKAPGEGSGLGLSMVYGFVKQSNGEVRIHSVPDRGTTVEFFLPVLERENFVNRSTGGLPDAEVSTMEGRVLVVEDHEQVRDFTCRMVRSFGLDAKAVPCAADALHQLSSGDRYDLVLSDVVMPGGISGRKLAQTVQRDWPDLPVLLVSGHADAIVDDNGSLGPRTSFLRKPFRRRELAAKLESLLTGS